MLPSVRFMRLCRAIREKWALYKRYRGQESAEPKQRALVDSLAGNTAGELVQAGWLVVAAIESH
jgi:hypothetical protein